MTDPDEHAYLTNLFEHNIAEYSVGELARSIKHSLESEFGSLRVKGEIARPTYHGSGHLYFTLKDSEAVIDGVCWRGNVEKLGFRLEEGMEVVCSGKVSSYAKSSKYQIVVASIELAGEGALLKLLEERRKKLADEGLFSDLAKKKLPFLPDVIGVVTSPTGAVIRDILHRLSARFPRKVIVWPVPVQGEGAAEKIASAVSAFNNIPWGSEITRPDLIIVARGGGSLEDLWCFNEEVVVRAVSKSEIPVISAIGHETDFTLIDFVADLRAPTPSAAAEMAVPVRANLSAQIFDCARRTVNAMQRVQEAFCLRVEGLGRGIPRPEMLFSDAQQSLDIEGDRLQRAVESRQQRLVDRIEVLGNKITHPSDFIVLSDEKLARFSEHLILSSRSVLGTNSQRLSSLEPEQRLLSALNRFFDVASQKIIGYGKLLESYSYKNVLGRGFALVKDVSGTPIKVSKNLRPDDEITLEFFDGSKRAKIVPDEISGRPRKKSSTAAITENSGVQGTLL
jgi:exodeoxyribonuclease VII large subunit